MPAVLSADRGAAGTWRMLIAGGIAHIAEIGAAGALQEVADWLVLLEANDWL